MTGHPIYRFANKRAQTAKWRQRGIAEVAVELPGKKVTVTRNELKTEGFLAIEVMIEGAFRNPDTTENFVNASRSKAFLSENFQACTQQQFAGVTYIFTWLRRATAAPRGL